MNTDSIEMIAIAKTVGERVPISHHPLFPSVWDQYAKTFNKLADHLDKAGLGKEIGMLNDVVKAAMEVERCSYVEIYKKGYIDGSRTVKRLVAEVLI